jgi:hypothetical protein
LPENLPLARIVVLRSPMSRCLLFAMCAWVLSCGGSSTGTTTTPDSGSTSDATSGGDAQSGSDSASGSDVQSASDGSSGGRVPVQHRPTGGACPQQRGPGMLTSQCMYDAGPPQPCLSDSDCTQGNNGRCMHPEYTPAICTTGCSYDACFSDSDCPTMQPCDCRPSATSNTANACVGGSQCRIDSDCGPGGYCSPSQGYGPFQCGIAYFCHTQADTCVNDTDCDSGRCQFDGTAKHWQCGGPTCAPPP